MCVYGSRADGTARATSDLDVLILGNEALKPESRAELKLAFSESNLPFFVDIVEQARFSTKFFEEITKQAEPLTNDLAVSAGKRVLSTRVSNTKQQSDCDLTIKM